MTETTYTHDQVAAALNEGTDLVDTLADAPGLLSALIDVTLRRLPPHLYGGKFTRDMVVNALNGAADQITEDGGETTDTIWADDVLNLAVNAISYVLDHPGAGLDEIIPAQYEDLHVYFDGLPENAPEPERGSPAWNAQAVKIVTGWIS